MNKNNLVKVRMNDKELEKLDFIVENHPNLIKRNRSNYIINVVLYDYSRIKKRIKNQEDELMFKYGTKDN